MQLAGTVEMQILLALSKDKNGPVHCPQKRSKITKVDPTSAVASSVWEMSLIYIVYHNNCPEYGLVFKNYNFHLLKVFSFHHPF